MIRRENWLVASPQSIALQLRVVMICVHAVKCFAHCYITPLCLFALPDLKEKAWFLSPHGRSTADPHTALRHMFMLSLLSWERDLLLLATEALVFGFWVWAPWIMWKWELSLSLCEPGCAPLYLDSIRCPSAAAAVGSAWSQFTECRPAAGYLHSATSDFPNMIQEWKHNCCISPVSLSFNSGSYKNTTSVSSCRVSGSPAVLFRWVLGSEAVTDVHCVEGFVIMFLLRNQNLAGQVLFQASLLWVMNGYV